MKLKYFLLFILLSSQSLISNVALAGDGATILFREGHVAYIANGYAQLSEEYKKLNSKESDHKIIELKLESSPFLINLAQVVIICRDHCTSLEITDPRRTKTEDSR